MSQQNNTSKLQQWLEAIWYKQGKGGFLLFPLMGFYCVINGLQRWLQTTLQKKLPCPVIIVGNITVGGTGKTPLTIYLVKLLEKAGYKPAIITRGYGGSAAQWPQTVTANSDPNLVGDEAVLMATRTDVPVYAGANRLASIQQLLKETDCDVIISDDGMQHYKLPRDIQIAVIDATRMLGNGYCLPAGPLREPESRLDNCDFIVLNGGLKTNNKSGLSMKLFGDVLVNLKTAKEIPLSKLCDHSVNAITGIGNPQRFYKTLEQGGLRLHQYSFPDHHQFTTADFQVNNDLDFVMTEKDAVKCKSFATDKFWYLPVSATLDNKFDSGLLEKLKDVVNTKENHYG